MDNIIESNLNFCAVLQKCPQIGHYVIGIDNHAFCKQYMRNDIQFKNSNGNTSLYITMNANILGDKIDKVVAEFENLYLKYIEIDKFSWNRTLMEWEEFRN